VADWLFCWYYHCYNNKTGWTTLRPYYYYYYYYYYYNDKYWTTVDPKLSGPSGDPITKGYSQFIPHRQYILNPLQRTTNLLEGCNGCFCTSQKTHKNSACSRTRSLLLVRQLVHTVRSESRRALRLRYLDRYTDLAQAGEICWKIPRNTCTSSQCSSHTYSEISYNGVSVRHQKKWETSLPTPFITAQRLSERTV
jgi:hypothetical protein